VGPRPESPLYARHYNERQKRVLDVKPGMVGPAQIKYRHEELILKNKENPDKFYVQELMPQKVEIDLDYIEKRSFLLDIKILLKTLLAVVMIGEKEETMETADDAPLVSENTP
jgi:lipopolysaccharide/colanic/teichoic acid biosynthesis glycosyltransferase